MLIIANISGITGYQWELGSTPNGWLYNGSPAPASISTTTNSLTLTTDGGTTAPSNITVTPYINNNPHPYSYTSTINFCACGTPSGLGVMELSSYALYFNKVYGITDYRLEWINLSTNASGAKDISYTESTYSFTDVSVGTPFRYRVAAITPCGIGAFSPWFDHGISGSCTTTLATDLTAWCACGSTCAGSCGYERFNWTLVSGASNYEVVYEIFNLNTGYFAPPETFTTSNVPATQPIPNYLNYTGPGWVIRFKVRTICDSGTYGSFTPWSSTFAL